MRAARAGNPGACGPLGWFTERLAPVLHGVDVVEQVGDADDGPSEVAQICQSVVTRLP
jgi:hypothetical protein